MNDDLVRVLQNLTVQVLSRLQESVWREHDKPPSQAILVTSALAGEGKTTVAEALARNAVAMTGGRVLLVDANPQRPRLHARFNLNASPGLVDALAGRAPLERLIRADALPGLDVLTYGDNGDSNLVPRQESMAALFGELQRLYDLVIVDGSVLQLTARSMLAYVLGVVVVVDAASTPREVVSGTLASLHFPRNKVLGVVLNRRPQYIPRLLYRLL